MERKRKFNWYGLRQRQRFSIRKYHFGAASVLLGAFLALGTNAAQAKADEAIAPVTVTTTAQVIDSTAAEAQSTVSVTAPTSDAVTSDSEAEASSAATSALQAADPATPAASTQSELGQPADSTVVESSIPATAETSSQVSAPAASEPSPAASTSQAASPALTADKSAKETWLASANTAAPAANTTTPTTKSETINTSDLASRPTTSDDTSLLAPAVSVRQATDTQAAFAVALEEMRRQGLVTETQTKELQTAFSAGLLDPDQVKQLIAVFSGESLPAPSLFTVFMAEGRGETPPSYAPHLHKGKIFLFHQNANTTTNLINGIYLANEGAIKNSDGTYDIIYQIYLKNITDPYAAIMISTDANAKVKQFYSWNNQGTVKYPTGADSFAGTDGDQTYSNSPLLFSDAAGSINSTSGLGYRVIVTTTSATGTGLTINVAQAQTEAKARSMAAGGAADDTSAKDSTSIWFHNYAVNQGPNIQPSFYFLPIGLTLTPSSNVRVIVEENPQSTSGYTITRLEGVTAAFGATGRTIGTTSNTLTNWLGSTDITLDPHTGIITGTVGAKSGGREGTTVSSIYAEAVDDTGMGRSDQNTAIGIAQVSVEGLSAMKNEGDTFTRDELFRLIRFRTYMGTSYGTEPLDVTMNNGTYFKQPAFNVLDNSTALVAKPYYDFVQKMELLDSIAVDGTSNTARIKVTYGNTQTGDTLGEMIYTVTYGYSKSPTVTPKQPIVTIEPDSTHNIADDVTIADADNSGYRSETVTITDTNGDIVYQGALGNISLANEGTYTVKVDVTDKSATQYSGRTTNTGYDEGTAKTVNLLDTAIHDLNASGTYTIKVVNQKAIINFVLDGQTRPDKSISESGKSGTAIPAANYTTELNNYKKLGYEVTNDNFNGSGTFDNNFTTDQLFTVVLRERLEPFDPSTPPVPGQPVNPNDPNSPVWPDNVKNQLGTETVTRTVKYVYAKDNSQAAPSVAETLTFKRLAKVNLVTGAVTFDAWSTSDDTFDAVKSPVITGFITNRAQVVEVTGVQATDADSEVLVTYTALGKYVPNIPNVPNFPDTPYPNDPTDPTRPQEPKDPGYPVIPHVPGYTPVDPKDPNDPNDDVPLTPVDPNDPSKGYIPPKPEDPTKDTPINYEADNQRAVIDFVSEDDDGNTRTPLTSVTENGKSNEAINSTGYTTALTGYLVAGYAVVSDNFAGTTHNFDTNTAVDQTFTVVLRERVEPFDPSTPPVPGQPVNPNDPNSPVWPDNVKDQLGTETVTRTVKYVYAKNNSQASAPVAETLTFKRLAKVNLVTGAVTFDAWTAVDTTFDAVKSPVLAGYIADKASVDAEAGIQAAAADSEVVVVYTALGKYVPNIPNVPNFPDAPYPNNPTDPTKPQNPSDPGYPVIPHVPGYTPVDPKDPNDPNDDVPLTPVDPNDPSKGYVPPTPEDPTKDRLINYEADNQKALINFTTDTGTALVTVTETGKSKAAIPTTQYTNVLEGYVKAGYTVDSDDFGNSAKSFDTNKDDDQTFTVVLRERLEPFDPSTPPVPGQPVNPNDPNSPVWPDNVE
ncbi:mucin-binding protein, partial [Streptococcus orisasini]